MVRVWMCLRHLPLSSETQRMWRYHLVKQFLKNRLHVLI